MRRTEPEASIAAGLAAKLRELTGFEEELVARQPPNAARVANEALARCLTSPGVDPGQWRERVRKVCIADRDRLLLALRQRSVGDEIRSEVDCPACGESSELTFRISELPSSTKAAAETEVDLPDGARIRLRPVTAGDQEDLLDDGTGDLTDVLSLVARNSEGKTLTREEVTGYGEATLKKLAEAVDRANPDLDIRLNLRCHACGRELVAPFDVEVFFFAELSRRAQTLVEDIHLIARTYHWSEEEILRLSWRRRAAFLRRIEADHDAELIGGQSWK